MSNERHSVFITGGTGYMGQRLIARLLKRGHDVRALVRPGSEKKLPAGCTPVSGNALDGVSYAGRVPPSDTFVQLVGVAHPSPGESGGISGGGPGLWAGSRRRGEIGRGSALCLFERGSSSAHDACLHRGAFRMRGRD